LQEVHHGLADGKGATTKRHGRWRS